MQPQQASRTALMTAYLRGYHAANDNPKIFDDSLALRLIPEAVQKAFEQHLADSSCQFIPESALSNLDYNSRLKIGIQVMGGAILARSRYTEDCLEESIAEGVCQYVILGAGLDTFAYRRMDMQTHLRVFEIDHPDTQATKRLMLSHAELRAPENLHYIPVDFKAQTLKTALADSEFNPADKTFFSWLGVTHYLPVQAISATLSDISGITTKGSRIVFDYWDKSAFDPEKASDRIKTIIQNTRRIGEPIITGLDPSNLGPYLEKLGWNLKENLNPSDIRRRFFEGRTDGYTASDHVNYACAVIEY